MKHISIFLVFLLSLALPGFCEKKYALDKQIYIAIFTHTTEGWIDPVGEESISMGDSTGMYYPTAEVKRRVMEYLNESQTLSQIYGASEFVTDCINEFIDPTGKHNFMCLEGDFVVQHFAYDNKTIAPIPDIIIDKNGLPLKGEENGQ
jgi:hypothetical protein